MQCLIVENFVTLNRAPQNMGNLVIAYVRHGYYQRCCRIINIVANCEARTESSRKWMLTFSETISWGNLIASYVREERNNENASPHTISL